MSVTRSATNSLAKDSRVFFGNHAGAKLRVASITTTTITVDSVAELTGTSLYSASTPGQVIIIEGVATSDHGKMADVTGISGNVLTVDVDLTAALADGDIIAVIPPLSVELFPPSGTTLAATVTNAETMGTTETFLTHNTPLTVDVGGDLPFYQTIDSESFGRLLAFGIGGYKHSAGTHTYRPIEANDTTFAASEDATVLVQDGNGVVRQALFGLFATNLTLNFPEGAECDGSVSILGCGAVREIGGAGKAFSSGANNYIRANFKCDTGKRHNFRGVFVELGGTFGDDLTDAAETTVKNLTVSVERAAITDRALGDPFIVKPEEGMFKLTVTGTRILTNDTFFENAHGASTDAEPGQRAPTRLLIKAVSPADTTKTLKIDIPNGVFTSHSITRQGQARYLENFTYTMIATLDSEGCVSTATPPCEFTLVNGVSEDALSAI